ncbi:BREX-2 system adenine-specific DNA-methyltransferase PglX [Actinacidiphila glaucinigra]|uniref:BREX-2 system adenine-specific DNA-methyltransferase PglX n=1 Tax=Actinacidiphila glaucinigra TaxID=235986 RepID=UPI0037CA20D1
MIDRKALLNDLKQQVKAVETDLARQVKAVAEVGEKLKGEYDQARKLGRTAATWNSWLDERVTQVAVAWLLGTVFVRFCEDNLLIPEPYLTGAEGDRRELAEARYDAYVDADADPTYRGWLERAFEELGAGQAGRLLFDRKHNPLYQIPLSHDGARELVEFWRVRDEVGTLVHDFTDPLNEDGTEGWDTRFLGDLYQDLSEAARKTYALLQTPEFVEEFILDRTMDPAVREFGYEGLKMIDPTCGSGHFVLGAFRRLVRLWAEGQPGRDVHERVRAALDSVHGVDLNPFAVAIARFRLLIASMAASGVRTLPEAAKYEWPIHLAVGDSLIKARQLELTLGGDEDGVDDPLASFAYATEDLDEHPGILQPGRYHVVVGNPPYIQVKDASLSEVYRQLYKSCYGLYTLSVPFIERFFELALVGDSGGYGFGRVGQITSNSFMKRKFGKQVIETFLARKVALAEVIDSSGADIPGHKTPTVILIGRLRGFSGAAETVRAVLGIQGKSENDGAHADGVVWRAIVDQIDRPGSQSDWVSVEDRSRSELSKHPWNLSGGGAADVQAAIEAASAGTLKEKGVLRVGFDGDTHADELFTLPGGRHIRDLAEPLHVRKAHRGDQCRDWQFTGSESVVFPYGAKRSLLSRDELGNGFARYFWPWRTTLWSRTAGTGNTYSESGRSWWEWHQLPKDVEAHSWSIAFGEIASHNHFVLCRDGAVFNRTAPVIKFTASATDEEFTQLQALLNSSTCCFWLKQVCFCKGNATAASGIADQSWSWNYQFNGTNVARIPLPARYPTDLAFSLDDLAQRLPLTSPSVVVANGIPDAAKLREAKTEWQATLGRMVALQEELDWQVYCSYDLYPDDLSLSVGEVPEISPGERAFEIVLARRMSIGEVSTKWFSHHGHAPVTEIPDRWPAPYRRAVQKRIDAIESSRAIGMIERPEYKRRWVIEEWDALQSKALRSWLLDRIESREHWYDENGLPVLVTLSRLADNLSRDEAFVSVANLFAPHKNLIQVVSALLATEHVPFLAALRYKETGLRKYDDWLEIWNLQRDEDAAGGEHEKRKLRSLIPVGSAYKDKDFLRASYWKLRDKFDVPKERFISYAQTDTATPDLYGWAGWDHRERAQALATYFTNQPLTSEGITPFLAGLLELQSWLNQWHREFDMMYSGTPADFFHSFRQTTQGEHGLTDDDLRAWRPGAKK